MTRADRLILWTCGLAIAASAATGSALVAKRPGVQPWVGEAAAWFERERRTIKDPVPARERLLDPWARIDAGRESHDSTAMYLVPAVKWPPPPVHPPTTVEIDPVAVTGAASAGLNGAAVEWTVADPPVALEPNESARRAPVKGFVIERSRAGDRGPAMEIARTGPEARSYLDRTADARETYRYRVRVADGRTTVTCKGCERSRGVTPGDPRQGEGAVPAP